MALIVGGKTSAKMESAEYHNLTSTNDDGEISANVINGVATYLLKSITDYDARVALNQLKARPVTHEKCVAARKFIDELPTISVVPNDVNHHAESGLIKFFWERKLSLDDEKLLAIVGEEGVEALRAQSTSMEIELLTIAQLASDALDRYTARLAAPRPSYTQSYRPISYQPGQPSNPRYPLLNFPPAPTKKRACECVIV